MKSFALAAVAAFVCIGAVSPASAADVGVSISVSQPGVYGRVDIGRFPQPAVVVQQPIYIERPVRLVSPPQPVYLWVPPGHQKHWSKHCGEYNACGAPVYFVRDEWYQRNVLAGGPMPRRYIEDRDYYRSGRGEWRSEGREGRGEWRGEDRDEGRGEGRGEGHGKGHGRGNGHGHKD